MPPDDDLTTCPSGARGRGVLRTRRLLLAPAQPDDLSGLHELWSQPDLRQAVWRNGPVREEQTIALIEWSHARFASTGHGIWCVRWHGTPEVVAAVIASAAPGATAIDVVFGVDRDHRFNRVATEAVTAVVAYLTTVLQRDCVRAWIEGHNLAAINVARSAGLALEQVTRTPTGELQRYALLGTAARLRAPTPLRERIAG